MNIAINQIVDQVCAFLNTAGFEKCRPMSYRAREHVDHYVGPEIIRGSTLRYNVGLDIPKYASIAAMLRSNGFRRPPKRIDRDLFYFSHLYDLPNADRSKALWLVDEATNIDEIARHIIESIQTSAFPWFESIADVSDVARLLPDIAGEKAIILLLEGHREEALGSLRELERKFPDQGMKVRNEARKLGVSF